MTRITLDERIFVSSLFVHEKEEEEDAACNRVTADVIEARRLVSTDV